MITLRNTRPALTVLALVCSAALARPADPDDPPLSPTSGPQLRAALAPYLWAPGINGSLNIDGLTVDLDLSLKDILDDTTSIYGFMGALNLEYGPALFEFNAAYMHLGADDQDAHAGLATESIAADIDIDAGWYEVTGGWRLIDRPVAGSEKRKFTLDALLGARITSMDVSVDATASADLTLPRGAVLQRDRSTNLSRNVDWVEMLVGARMGWDFADRWTLSLRGDVGGFGIGPDEFAWQAIALLGYRFHIGSANATLFAGYRALSQDYEDDNFEWNATVHGPILGLEFTF